MKKEGCGVGRVQRASRTAITMRFKSVEYAESYLFPHFWSSRILKEVPEKKLSSLLVYGQILLENGR